MENSKLSNVKTVKTNVFVAYDYSGHTLSILLAPNRRDAELFWQGQGIFANSVREVDPTDVNTPLNILELLKTKKVKLHQDGGSFGKTSDYIVVDKS